MEGYKILNGVTVKMTDAEIEELKKRPAPTEPTPTLEERIAAAEAKISIGEEGAAELEQIKGELLNIIDIMEGA